MSKIFKADSCILGLPLPVGEASDPPSDDYDSAMPGDGLANDLAGVLLDEAKAEVRALIAEAVVQADEIVRDAQAEKDSLLAAARQQAAGIEAEAYRLGREKGEAEGQAKVAAAEKMLAEAEAIRQEALTQRDELISGAEGEIVRLVLAIAAKVIKTEIAASREAVLNLVREGISELAGARNIVVRGHPTLTEKLTGEADDLSRLAAGAEISISSEPSFDPGECQIESEYGILDTGVDTQLNNIAKAMQPVTTDAHI